MKCPREYQDVQFAEDGVSSISGITVKRWVARETISRIVLRNGFTAQRPIRQFLIGSTLFLVSLSIIIKLGSEIVGPGVLLLLLLAIVGCRLMFIALAQGLHLEVIYGNRRAKFPFRGKPQIQEFERFLQKVEEQFGYTIERSGATGGFPVKLVSPIHPAPEGPAGM